MATAYNDPNLMRVLVVDDDEIVRARLKEELAPMGYSVVAVDHPKQVLLHLRTEQYSVILSDYKMPDMDGLQLFAAIEELADHRDTSRLLFSSGIGMLELMQAIGTNRIYRHVSKPWLKEDLQAALANAVERYRLLKENEMLHDRNIQLSQKIAAGAGPAATASAPVPVAAAPAPKPTGDNDAETPAAVQVQVGPDGEDLALESFNRMLSTFHPNLGSTARRAVAICQTLCEILQLSPADTRQIILAAHLHDIGLVSCERGVVRRWMRDPEKCTEEELADIQRHPVIAEELLQYYPGFAVAAPIIRHHHERWDGLGYPDKLKGETIPRLARFLSPVIFFCNQHTADVKLMQQMESMVDSAFDRDAVRHLSTAYQRTKMPKGEREVLLLELKPDMVLARDIVNTNGLKLLPKGRQLTEGTINKVIGINRLTPINPYCLVYC